VAFGGTSYAAVKINGKNIKNKTISGAKLKDRTLTEKKLSKATLDGLKKAAGTHVVGQTGPTGPSGAASMGAGYSAFKTIGAIPAGARAAVAQLDNIPAGNYVIFAKLHVVQSPLAPAASVECRLETGADFDESDLSVAPGNSGSMSLNVVRSFSGPGSAVLRCSGGGQAPEARYTKITAIQVDTLRNLPSP
jgi:hypothetical protein